MVDAAAASGVKVVAVTSTDNSEIVREVLCDRFNDGLTDYDVKPLTDTELDQIVKAFPELEQALCPSPVSRSIASISSG